jgi:glycosyltransferase involved in cell wall biosynthesis
VEENVKSIFIAADYYLPGFKAGGPQRSISNLVRLLENHYQCMVFTRNRDAYDNEHYDTVISDCWNQVGKSKVYYASRAGMSLQNIRRLLIETKPDSIYLNSFFSTFTVKILFLRRLGLVPYTPVLIAPRGEFNPGALRIKWVKKSVYRLVAKITGVYQDIHWQASSEHEVQAIKDCWQDNLPIHIAPDLVQNEVVNQKSTLTKEIGQTRIIFLSRITPMKNLAFALELLKSLNLSVVFDIFGPIGDEKQWQIVSQLLASMPENVRVAYRGVVPSEDVIQTMSQYHFFLLPTLGENFGHVIIEAFTAGCLVIISDRTPWKKLDDKGIGWDISLEDKYRWESVLKVCIEMEQAEFDQLSYNARQFAQQWRLIQVKEIIQQNIDMFQLLLNTQLLSRL